MSAEILQRAFFFCPLLGAAVGYMVDGLAGAASAFLIPIGPLVVLCLVGARPQ
jgi:hypothetical protein